MVEHSSIAWEKITSAIHVEWLSHARWFRRKSAEIRHIRFLDGIKLESPLARDPGFSLILLLEIETSDQESDVYFLPLRLEQSPGPGDVLTTGDGYWVKEAADSPYFLTAFHRHIQENRELAGRSGVFRFQRFSFQGLRQCRPLAQGSSNTLVLLRGNEVFKFFRRIEAGPFHELEMNKFFAETGSFTNLPALTGALNYLRPDGAEFTLALSQLSVENEGNLWSQTQSFLEKLLLVILEEQGDRLDEIVLDFSGKYFRSSERLGCVLANMHQALTSGAGGPHFQVEPITSADLAMWARAIEEKISSVLAKISIPPPGAHEIVVNLVNRREAVRSRLLDAIRKLNGLSPQGWVKCRIHGDFHLGQVLAAGDDFFIMDFEGEPLKDMAQRTAKHTPLKDVAGMCRSFNYAVYAALYAATVRQHIRPEIWHRLESALMYWNREVERLFLGSYFHTMGWEATGGQQMLLAVLKLEKAIHELEYEMDNRPDWLAIPVAGLEACLSDILLQP